ncbi:hypothetical protein NUW58_g4264 [Xylaria curta]|uniref:Uncharacterized protein n=1 Tax=Xylaria curta TaxID=42375 RepID=A0ACC1P8N9_9PEZI|nr:hypothetical protein NUW58_g4264 [Xylaria curta]
MPRARKVKQATDLSDDIRTRFQTSPYWEYERFLGQGAFGATFLLRERDHVVRKQKRMALKLAQHENAYDLRHEMQVLEGLRGAKHIVKMLASCKNLAKADTGPERNSEDLSSIELIVEKLGPLISIPPSTAFRPLAGLSGAAMALEFLEYGDLYHFAETVRKARRRWPDRVLWSLFLCMIRVCIGMAYPPGRRADQPLVLETINPDIPAKVLTNSDIAKRNIMITSGDGHGEHHDGHMFKMIDFGLTEDLGGYPYNLHDVAMIVSGLIDSKRYPEGYELWKGHMSRRRALLPTKGHDPYPEVDFALRDLIGRCTYYNVDVRPTLEVALAEATKAVARASDTFPTPAIETDEAIREFWQTLLHNPPTAGPS